MRGAIRGKAMSASNKSSFLSYPAMVSGDEIGEALVLAALGHSLAKRYDGVVDEPLPFALARLLETLRDHEGANRGAR
jgi:hypothetical protein